MKQIPLIDWFLLIPVPILTYISLLLIVRNILLRPSVSIFIRLDDFNIVAAMLFFSIFLRGNWCTLCE